MKDTYKEKFYKILESNIFANKYGFAVEHVKVHKRNSGKVVFLQ